MDATGSSLTGKSLFVTGGNVGIGLATALLFARQGCNVTIFARRSEVNERARAEIETTGAACLAISGDVTAEAQLRDAIATVTDRFGGLHFAFNNAGVSQPVAPLTALQDEDLHHQLDVNLRAAFLGMKHQIPAIARSGGGAICNNASLSGIRGTSHQALYAASKFGMVGLTRSAALECAGSGVRINAVCPGATTGDMHRRWAQANPDAATHVKEMIPMGRIGLKEEVAQAVLFLCRDATYTTGATLPVDGGLVAG